MTDGGGGAISEAMIRDLVHAFYAKIRVDPKLGPIFAARIADWPPDLEQMCAFWSSATMGTARYHGRPMPKHAPRPIDASHLDRWLGFFAETAAEVCPAPQAAIFVERAQMIGRSLEMGIGAWRRNDMTNGRRLPPLGA